MALNTYALLKTAIANWLENDSLTDRIPEFIALGETRIARTLRVRGMVRRDTSITTVSGTEYYTLPTDFLEARNVQLNMNPIRKLKFYPLEQIDDDYPNNAPSTPCVYSIVGLEIQLRPIPNAAVDLELAYYRKLDALTDANQTNWFTSFAPDLILYSALIEAEAYLVDDKRVEGWKALLEQSIAEWNRSDEKGRFSGSHIAQRTGSNP